MPITDDDGTRPTARRRHRRRDRLFDDAREGRPRRAGVPPATRVPRDSGEPFADEVLGEPAYDELADVEADVDLVNVFRPSEEIPEILGAVRERHAERGDAGAAWIQLGISHDEAAADAESDGIEVVQDRCMKVEHKRLRG